MSILLIIVSLARADASINYENTARTFSWVHHVIRKTHKLEVYSPSDDLINPLHSMKVTPHTDSKHFQENNIEDKGITAHTINDKLGCIESHVICEL